MLEPLKDEVSEWVDSDGNNRTMTFASDWAYVFGEANESNCPPLSPNRPPFDTVTSTATFGREDVEEIVGMVEGERDERDWVCYGRLKDGRWFVARGGCDYTGWDCQAGNSSDVADSRLNIEQFGLSESERKRMIQEGGVTLVEAPPVHHTPWALGGEFKL